jgi:hypothetical protein
MGLPADFKDYQAVGFAIAYPSGWQAGRGQQGGSLYVVPQGGVAESQNGGVELLLGAMIDYYQPQGGKVSLDGSTGEFIQSLQKGDANLRAEKSSRTEVGGKPALTTKLTTRTSNQREPDQTVYLYTVERDAGLWYLVMAAPPSRLGEVDPIFRQMLQTVQFPD